MEVLLALVIGVLGGAGVWLVLRPRTFQVVMGLALLSYSVNLFIFSMGSLSIDQPPIIAPGMPADLEHYSDPMPQATDIVHSAANASITEWIGAGDGHWRLVRFNDAAHLHDL